MPSYTYINVSNTFLHVFLKIGSISKHFSHTNCSPGPFYMVPPWWADPKVRCFQTSLWTA